MPTTSGELIVYIYGLYDPTDGRLRYIGKSKDPHGRYVGHLRKSRTKEICKYPMHYWILRLLNAGYEPVLDILEEVSVSGWRVAEKEWITNALEDGHDLLNLSEGGEGGPMGKYKGGYKRSAEHNRKLAEAKRGRKLSEEHKRKIGDAGRGKKRTEETRRRMSIAASKRYENPVEREKSRQAALGRIVTVETRRKLREANLGKHHSEETRRKISDAHRGKPLTQEHREKIGAALRGRKVTAETKRKLSKAAKRQWRRLRAKQYA